MFFDSDSEQGCRPAVAFKQPADPLLGNAFVGDAARGAASLDPLQAFLDESDEPVMHRLLFLGPGGTPAEDKGLICSLG